MVRTQPSGADLALIAAAAARGATPSATQIERWRSKGLFPRNERQGAGHARGSVSTPPLDAVDLLVWLSAHARPGRRPDDVALEAFAAGLPVPEATVRRAWLAAATDLQLEITAEPEDAARRSDWIAGNAQQLAARHDGRSALIPRRIREIDARIVAAGISFAAPEMAAFDKGTYGSELYTGRDLTTVAVTAALGGMGEISEGDLAAFSRALVPADSAVPVAAMLEYPEGGPALADISDGQGLTLLPTGDVRDDLSRVINEASLAQLRTAWQAVDEMHRWAASSCDAVEAELDALAAGEPLTEAPALQQWFLGVTLGLNRLLLRQALLEPAPSATARASTATMLIFLATGMSRLRVMVPESRFELLPALLPPFLHELAEMVRNDPPASLRP